MAERWLDRARRAVPPAVRESCLEPVLADLHADWIHRRASAPAWRRPLLRGRFLLHLGHAVLQCRRLARAETVAATRGAMSTSLFRALFHAGRRLRREPRFTAAVVLTLALGLGANVTVFTFIDAFLIAPLPVPDPQRLVRVGEVRDGRLDITSFPNYRDVRDTLAPVVDLAAHVQTDAQLGEGEGAQLGTAELVSGNYFQVMRLTPQLGRLLGDHDNQAELAHPVAVISDRYWRRFRAADPAIVGQTLQINGATFEIVGVAPPGFGGTFAAHQVDAWVPLMMQGWVRPRGLSVERRTWGWLRMIGRMREGVTFDRVRVETTRASDVINQQFPPARASDAVAFTAVPAAALSESDAEGLRPLLQAVFAFTLLLFLATCANLTGIFQSRLASRTRELAIRQSLGAGRWRLAFEWMIECTLVALLGGLAALGIGVIGARVLMGMDVPAELVGTLRFDAAIGWRVVAFTVGLSLVGAVLFGAGTAWRAGRRAPVSALKDEGGAQAGGARRSRARRMTVALQVAASVVLLVVGSLLATSLSRQFGADPGFDAERLGVMSLSLQRQRVPQADWPALIDRALAVARTTPGVTAAATAMRPPLGLGKDVQTVRIPGYTPPDDRPTVSVDFNSVTADYFATLGLRFLAGGPWNASVSATPSVVINETMARRFWKDGDALGRAITVGRTAGIVSGIVADSAYYEIGEAPRPMLYVPSEVGPAGNFGLFFRTDGDPAAVAAAVARALSAADARLAPANVMSFGDLRRVVLFPARLLAIAALVFSAISLLLTLVGLYGVIAASVADRTREIGVRLALGAAPSTVQVSVVREALVLCGIGAVLGGLAGYGAAVALRGWLFAVSPFDPLVYAGVLALVTMVAVASAWLPARHAARIDPVTALR